MFILPKVLNSPPIRVRDCAEIWSPILHEPQALMFPVNVLSPKMDTLEPTSAFSATEKLRDILADPATEQLLPSRAHRFKVKLLPTVLDPITLMFPPILVFEKTLTLEPRRAKHRNETELPTTAEQATLAGPPAPRIAPQETERVDPSRTAARIDAELPTEDDP